MKIAYVDCETTGTNPDYHEMWELGVILVDEESLSVDQLVFQVPFINMDRADPKALEIGGFANRYEPEAQFGRQDLAIWMEARLRDYRVASCNVSFDVGFMRAFMMGENRKPTWHYSPIDVKSMCYGAHPDLFGARTDDLIEAAGLDGQTQQVEGVRHSALFDARIAKQLCEWARYGVRG